MSIYAERTLEVGSSRGPLNPGAESLGKHYRPLRMHQDSSQVREFFQPVNGVRDQQVREGVKPTNHSRNNRAAIKEMSAMNK